MGCFFGTIGVIIIWPASAYFLLGFLGWLGTSTQTKLQRLFNKPNDWLDKKIPIIKFKNVKPLLKNIPNLIYNICIMFPLRLIITLSVTLSIGGIWVVLAFYSQWGLRTCW